METSDFNNVYRAVSVLTEKQIIEDGKDTIVRGWATTPTPDRVDDIVEPLGMVLRSDQIKMHLYHDTRLPVGPVSFGKPQAKGVPFEAVIPHVEEAGIVRDRLNEARHSIKYGLISAVSIGFRAFEDAVERLKNGGLRFLKWEMIELSLTSAPANPDALITAVKTFEQTGRLPESVLRSIRSADAGEVVKLISARDIAIKNGAVSLR